MSKMKKRTTTRIKPKAEHPIGIDRTAHPWWSNRAIPTPNELDAIYKQMAVAAMPSLLASECGTRSVGKIPELAAPYGEPKHSVTAFHLADEAAGALRVLQERVCSLADRLLGCEPQNASNVDIPMPSGTLNQLDAQAREAMRRIAQANEALSRIEAALP